jgi:hypothetical protein
LPDSVRPHTYTSNVRRTGGFEPGPRGELRRKRLGIIAHQGALVADAAHHGAAAFENDPAKRLTMKGTVVEWFWANPHCFLQFDVKGEDGKVSTHAKYCPGTSGQLPRQSQAGLICPALDGGDFHRSEQELTSCQVAPLSLNCTRA